MVLGPRRPFVNMDFLLALGGLVLTPSLDTNLKSPLLLASSPPPPRKWERVFSRTAAFLVEIAQWRSPTSFMLVFSGRAAHYGRFARKRGQWHSGADSCWRFHRLRSGAPQHSLGTAALRGKMDRQPRWKLEDCMAAPPYEFFALVSTRFSEYSCLSRKTDRQPRWELLLNMGQGIGAHSVPGPSDVYIIFLVSFFGRACAHPHHFDLGGACVKISYQKWEMEISCR